MPCVKRFRHYILIAEAAALLSLARLLVARVPMRYWRGSLGRVGRDATACALVTPAVWPETPPALRRIAFAVERASLRLPFQLRCLPRAMAVQWMARRRRLDCTLHIGLARTAEEPLHAWIDCGAETLIGSVPDRSYHSLLAIRSR